MKGIVHDASGSGQTLFVEPLVAVELGNAWREAQVAEQRGDRAHPRRAVGARRGQRRGPARDPRRARAGSTCGPPRRPSPRRWTATRAETADRPEVVLLSRPPSRPHRPRRPDRHPPRRRLHRARRHRPEHRRQDRHAADARPAVPDAPVRAARPGRRRAAACRSSATCSPTSATSSPIAQSLSTFSGHLRSITAIVEAAGPGTLVLLDELGAGTDPTEGSALAQALLDHFIRAGATRRRDDPLRRAQGLRAHDARGAQRLGRVRPRDAVADLPADDRAAGRQPGVRDRRAPRAAATRSSRMPDRG